MSSKTRMLGAGRAGSTAYGSNVNMIQLGDKLQGLAPKATHFFIAGNGRAGWNNYRKRTNAPRRNVIFCMNQLGGVGRARSQFKIGGVNNPDGTRCGSTSDMLFYPFGKKAYISLAALSSYFKTSLSSLILAGRDETLVSDGVYSRAFSGDTTLITHYYPGTDAYAALPPMIQKHCDVINDNTAAPLKDGGDSQRHVVATCSFENQQRLIAANHGIKLTFGPHTYVMMYGFSDCCQESVIDAVKSYIEESSVVEVCHLYMETAVAANIAAGGPEDVAGDAATGVALALYTFCQSVDARETESILSRALENFEECCKTLVENTVTSYFHRYW
jgi:hypothetical protein